MSNSTDSKSQSLLAGDAPIADASGDASDDRGTRRNFLVNALVSMPALAYLYGCEGGLSHAQLVGEQLQSGAGGMLASINDPAWAGISRRERARRQRLRALLRRHVQAENDHDLDGIMRTMDHDAEMVVNGLRFDTPDAIRGGHAEFGMSDAMGGLVGTEVVVEQESFTDDAILTHGYLRAKHVDDTVGFPGAGIDVELTFAAFYQFNRRGKLVSERITMDWGPLLAGAIAATGP